MAMHRTQILLEEDQYETLCARARQEGQSIGAMVRELLGDAFASGRRAKANGSALRDLKGLFRKPGLRGRRHDEYLYGAP
jgi:hypothetical protein